MSNVKTTSEQKVRVEPVMLLDCGQASKVTKGWLFFILSEGGWPPADRFLF